MQDVIYIVLKGDRLASSYRHYTLVTVKVKLGVIRPVNVFFVFFVLRKGREKNSFFFFYFSLPQMPCPLLGDSMPGRGASAKALGQWLLSLLKGSFKGQCGWNE